MSRIGRGCWNGDVRIVDSTQSISMSGERGKPSVTSETDGRTFSLEPPSHGGHDPVCGHHSNTDATFVTSFDCSICGWH